MTSLSRAAGSLMLALLLQACTPAGDQDSPTLIIDITTVAKALGRDEVMARQLEQTQAQLNQQLRSITQDLNTRIRDKREQIGEDAAEEDRQALEALTLQARNTLEQSRELARQQALAYRSSLVQEFQAEVRERAAHIARQRGATVVLLADQASLWFDPRSDITDEVIAALRAQAQESGGAAGPAAPEAAPEATGDAPAAADTQN